MDEDEEFFQAPGVYSLYMIQDLEVTYRTPKPSVCMTWNGNKIKTFDGVTYSHELVCSHTLVQDFIDGTFNIILRACPFESTQPCSHALEVFIQNEQFTFENTGGQVKMFTTKKEIPIPVQMTGLKVTRSGMDVRIVMEQIPITITWDNVTYFSSSIQFIKKHFLFSINHNRPFLSFSSCLKIIQIKLSYVILNFTSSEKFGFSDFSQLRNSFKLIHQRAFGTEQLVFAEQWMEL